MTTALLVIGGGPSGLAAARAYRASGGEGEVVLVSADLHLPYNRPPLSKGYLRGESDEDSLPLEDELFYRENHIVARLATPAVALDTRSRTITVADGDTIGYRMCVLATGASPKRLPVPGADHAAVRYLRSWSDAGHLRQTAAGARSAVVVGSGFIGCEAAASLAFRGLDVTLVTAESLPQAVRLGRPAGERILQWLRADGIRVRLDAEVEGIDGGQRVRLGDGTSVEGDLLLVAGGIEPAITVARGGGLAIDHGRIRVDAHMASSAPGVLAAGDVAFAYNPTAGRRLVVEHWGEALAMGNVAGSTAAGADASWSEVPGFWSTIGDHTIKYAAWGDGFERAHIVSHDDESFTVWYERDGAAVGVLTHDADGDYDQGLRLIEEHQPPPIAQSGLR